MSVNISLIGGAAWQFFDDNGVILSGGRIYTYLAGTTTPAPSYTSSTGGTLNPNPIVLDAAGRPPEEIWVTNNVTYKFVIKDANDVLIRSYDNIPSFTADPIYVTLAELASTTDKSLGDALVGFRQSNSSGFLANSVGRPLNDKVNETISSTDFTTLQNAIDVANTGANVQIPGTPTYDETISWKGRKHQTDGLPFKLNDVTWSGADLNARMCVFDGVLYLCEYQNSKIAMFSLADPRNPTFIGSFTTDAQPRHVEVVGRYVFVACHGANSIQIFDATIAGSATVIGTIATGANPKMFQIVGHYIYVACFGSSTVEKWSYSLPTSGLVGFSAYRIASTAVSSGPLCLAVNENGLMVVCGLNTASIDLLGSTSLNLLATVTVGVSGHASCVWVTDTQFLVTNSANNKLYSCKSTSLDIVVTGSADTSSNPEQVEVVGNRCYVPSLTSSGVAAYLDAFDITNSGVPVKYKSVPLSVTGAGFTAYYEDGDTGYIYVNGHFAPYNLDVVEVVKGSPNRVSTQASEMFYSQRLGAANATVASFSYPYSTTTVNKTLTAADGFVRVGLGATITLPDPALMPQKAFTIENASSTASSILSNPYGPFSELYIRPFSAITVASQGSPLQWDKVSSYTDPTYHDYATYTSNVSLTNSNDYVRLGLGAAAALPDPSTMPGKQFIIKNVHASSSSNITNAYTGYSGTLTPGQSVILIAGSIDKTTGYQWEAVANY